MAEHKLTVVDGMQARKHTETRLRQSDEIFRLLVEGVRDYAIFLLDPDGNVATWNAGAERIKGYTAEEIIGQHFSRFYPTEARESRWPERELEIAAKEGRFVDEGLRVRKDGSTFWANVVITALRDDRGELRGFSKVTRDLTDRRALEERTRLLNKELRNRVAQLLESQHQVESRTLELQRLSRELMSVQDEERRRMARTLHDDPHVCCWQSQACVFHSPFSEDECYGDLSTEFVGCSKLNIQAPCILVRFSLHV